MSQSITGSEPKSVTCPGCGKAVAWTPRGDAQVPWVQDTQERPLQQRWRPFCSERCRLIDLGEWASDTRRIPVNESSREDSAE